MWYYLDTIAILFIRFVVLPKLVVVVPLHMVATIRLSARMQKITLLINPCFLLRIGAIADYIFLPG